MFLRAREDREGQKKGKKSLFNSNIEGKINSITDYIYQNSD